MRQCRNSRLDEMVLRSSETAPYDFTVRIVAEARNKDAARTFEVTGQNIKTHAPATKNYFVNGREHKDYLQLLNGIAQDFGTRVPRHCRPEPAFTFQAEYSELLTHNLSPKILYGYGDPAVLPVKGKDIGEEQDWYYLVSTSNDAPDCFPIIRSTDLKDWKPRGFIFPQGQTPRWAAVGYNVADFWAPEIHKVGGEFRAYFAARHKSTSELCIGFAKAEHPDGPYIPRDEPILIGNRIDPHLFVENDSEAYLYWKEDSNGVWPSYLNNFLFEFPDFISRIFKADEDRRTASLTAALWPWSRDLEPMERSFVQQPLLETVTSKFSSFGKHLQALAAAETDSRVRTKLEQIVGCLRTCVYAQLLSLDGQHLLGQPKKVLENDQAWEAHVVEGIWVMNYLNRYYMFYAGNDFATPDYGIGVAVGDSPFGPFLKGSEAVLRSTPRWAAPGHPCATINSQSKPVLLFHGYPPGRAGYKQFRALLSVVLEFKDVPHNEPATIITHPLPF